MRKTSLIILALFLFVYPCLNIFPAQNQKDARSLEKEYIARENKINQGLTEAVEPDSPFGMVEFLSWNHQWNNYKYPKKDLQRAADMMRECGVSIVRFDFLWNDIEAKPGEFDFSKYDYIVSLLTERNIKILGLLSYSADWAGKAWNGPAYDDRTFINYAAKTIERYKGKVKYWEIWNEPDDQQYWAPQDGMARYSSLLKKAYNEAKRIDPNCVILNGGLSKNVQLSLGQLYQNGAGRFFDILAIHAFVNPRNEQDVARVKGLYTACKKIMEKNGDKGKKIWFTELGCPGVGFPSQSNSWWLGMSPLEEQQADLVKEVYTGIIRQMPDCEKVFWAYFRDCKNYWNNGVDYFGLVRWDFSRKPSFFAYQEAAGSSGVTSRFGFLKGLFKDLNLW